MIGAGAAGGSSRAAAQKRHFKEEDDGGDDGGGGLHSNNGGGKRAKPANSPPPPSSAPFRLRRLSSNDRPVRSNDQIHCSVHMCPATKALVDTEVFQRLDDLKQLGAASYVYRCTKHSRLEHSLGVYELAGRMIRRVSQRQPQLNVSSKDVLCTKLAGLLHDVGHGPFSHTYEDFIKRSLPAYLEANPDLRRRYDGLPEVPESDWKHEAVSLRLVDAALEELGLRIDLENLDAPLEQIGSGIDARSMRVDDFGYGDAVDGDDGAAPAASDGDGGCSVDPNVLTSRDFVFIKECIWGVPIPNIERVLGPGFHGREPAKQWMYDIVCNSHSGLDVDKMDYFARDERSAFGEAGQINTVMLEEVFVAIGTCESKGCKRACVRDGEKKKHLMLCYPEKVVDESLNFFKKRLDLFTKIYKHKTCSAATFMICDAMCYADPFFRLPVDTSNNNRRDSCTGQLKRDYDGLPISRAMIEPAMYKDLDDSILKIILNESKTNPDLEKAGRLIRRLKCRDLYKCAGIKRINMESQFDVQLWSKTEDQIKSDMVDRVAYGSKNGERLERDDFIVEKCDIHYGSGEDNPLAGMRFLNKSKLGLLRNPVDKLPEAEKARLDQYESSLPRSFQKNSIRIFSRTHGKTSHISHVFQQWLSNMEHETEQTPDGEAFFDNPGDSDFAQAAVLLSQEQVDCDGVGSDDDDDEEEEDADNDNYPLCVGAVGSSSEITPPRRR